MTDKNTGGPAFPLVELDRQTGNVCEQHFGMTLRDYFAAKAIIGVFNEEVVDVERAAKWCYEMADAMIKEKNK